MITNKLCQSDILEMNELVELKINDDVFNDLKENKENENKAHKNFERIILTPSNSSKMNNLMKSINHSQSMTLNDSLNFSVNQHDIKKSSLNGKEDSNKYKIKNPKK